MPITDLDEITICPNSGGCAIKSGKHLVVFFPEFLLGKHGANAQRAGSRFHKISTVTKLTYFIHILIKICKLRGDRVELKEVQIPSEIGIAENGVIKLNEDTKLMVTKKKIGDNQVNVLVIPESEIPPTKKVNMVLVKYNPQFGNDIHAEFQKITGVSFEKFDKVYAILTIYPGNHAPPFDDHHFWNNHALLEPLQ